MWDGIIMTAVAQVMNVVKANQDRIQMADARNEARRQFDVNRGDVLESNRRKNAFTQQSLDLNQDQLKFARSEALADKKQLNRQKKDILGDQRRQNILGLAGGVAGDQANVRAVNNKLASTSRWGF